VLQKKVKFSGFSHGRGGPDIFWHFPFKSISRSSERERPVNCAVRARRSAGGPLRRLVHRMDGVHLDSPSPVARSADETKYDGRHMRDKLAMLHRAAIVLLVTVAIVTVFGDGLLVRSKIRKQQEQFKTGALRLVRGERVRSRFDPVAEEAVIDDTSEAERLAREEAAERSALDAKRQQGLANAWGADGDSDEAASDAHHHKPPAPASRSTNGGEGAAAGSAAAASGAAAAAADDSVDWSLLQPDQCTGYFGNGYSEYQVLVGGSDASEYFSCRGHPITHAYYCRARSLLLRPSAIKLSRGGEALDQVNWMYLV
jgi:hypothetical protein